METTEVVEQDHPDSSPIEIPIEKDNEIDEKGVEESIVEESKSDSDS